jgi:hypothetical protein
MDSQGRTVLLTNNKLLHLLSIVITLLTIFAAGVGLCYETNGSSYNFINQYGDTVKIYGHGLYTHDSFFRAPIFRGTDFVMLFVLCPLLIVLLINDIRKRNLKSRLWLISVIGCFLYYAASIAFGVTYNFLQLVYIFLFSLSFFGLITGIMSIRLTDVAQSIQRKLPYRGISIFLVITGIALFAAWLPDIITALLTDKPLLLIENYTTEITYVIDMGIIAPTCFVCLYLLKSRRGLGYVLLDILITLCIIIGIILPVQTVFQIQAGIELPLAAIIIKMASFCVLALFALYFKIRFLKAVRC